MKITEITGIEELEVATSRNLLRRAAGIYARNE